MGSMTQVRPVPRRRGRRAARRAPTPLAGRRPGPARRRRRPRELTVRAHLPAGRSGRAVLLRELHRQGRVRRRGVRLGDRRHRRHHPGGGGRRAAGRTEPRGHGQHRADHRRRPADRPAAVQRATVQRRGGAQTRRVRRRCSPCCPASTSRRVAAAEQNDRDQGASPISSSAASARPSARGWPATSPSTPTELVDQLAAIIDALGRGPAVSATERAATLRARPAVRRGLRHRRRVALGEFLGPAGELERDAVGIVEVERPHVDAGVQRWRRPAPRSRRG